MIFAFVYSGDYLIGDEMAHVKECYTIDYDIDNETKLSLQYDATVTNANGEQNDLSEMLDFYNH